MSSLTKLELTQVSLRLDSCFVEQSKTTGCASSSSSSLSAMRSASISLCERKRFKYAGRKNVRSIRHVSSQASSGFSARDALFDERQLRETLARRSTRVPEQILPDDRIICDSANFLALSMFYTFSFQIAQDALYI